MTQPHARKLRTPEDYDHFRMALVPVDQAFFASETKWGVGRLERLVSSATLAAYQRGWSAYRAALDDGDPAAVEAIAPKMLAALAFMDSEATAAGYRPLAPDTWECGMADGTVLVVVRSNAEAAAVIRAEKAVVAATGRPALGMTVVSGDVRCETPPPEPASTEMTLPPDLAVTIRQQHEGRRLEVWSLSEISNLIQMYGSVGRDQKKWDGTEAHSGRQMPEGAAADLVRTGYPLVEPLAADVRSSLPVPTAITAIDMGF